MNILLATRYAPYPVRGGSSQRSQHLYRALQARGHVRLLTLESPTAFDDTERQNLIDDYHLVGMGPVTPAGSSGLWKPLHRWRPALATRLAHNLDASRSIYQADRPFMRRVGIAELLKDVDLVVGRYTAALTRLDLHRQAVPTLLDVDDLDSDIYRSRLQAATDILDPWFLKRHLANIEAQEASVFSQLDGLWIANPENRSHPGLKRAGVLPNIPWLPAGETFNTEPVVAGNHRVMCIASFAHRPNVEGVQWFLDTVWPPVLAAVPDAEFMIYGSSLHPAVRRRWAAVDRVQAIGYIDKVSTAYARSATSICPVLTGAGTNIKVLEAAAHQRCCVLTPMAARGFRTDEDLSPHLIIGQDAGAMAAHLVALLRDAGKNNARALTLRDAVARRHSTATFEQVVHDTIDEVMTNRKACRPRH